MSSRDRSARVDGWLRRGLAPPAGAGGRVAARALEGELGPATHAPRLRGLAVLTAALSVSLLAALWSRGGGGSPSELAAPEAVVIANFGGVVAVVDPAGTVRLSGPTRRSATPSTDLDIRLGGSHEP